MAVLGDAPGAANALPDPPPVDAAAGASAKAPDQPKADIPNGGMAPGLVGAVRGYIGRQQELGAAEEKNRQEYMGVPLPKMTELPKPPETKTTDFMESFGSAAMALAGLGSLMTRRPLTNALNAGAAVMQAFHKNDLEATQQAYQKWEVETKNAMAMHQFEQEAYRNVMDKYRGNADMLRAALTANAASFKDEAALAMLNRGDTQGALALITGRESLGGRMGTAQTKLKDEYQDFTDMQTARAAYRKAEAAGDPDAMAAAQAQFADVQQRIRDRKFASNPLAWDKEERLGQEATRKDARLSAAQEFQREKFETEQERKSFEFGIRMANQDRAQEIREDHFKTRQEWDAYKFGVEGARKDGQFAAKNRDAEAINAAAEQKFAQVHGRSFDEGNPEDKAKMARVRLDVIAEEAAKKAATVSAARQATTPKGQEAADVNERARERFKTEKGFAPESNNDPRMAELRAEIKREDLAKKTAETVHAKMDGQKNPLTPEAAHWAALSYLNTGSMTNFGMGGAAARSQILEESVKIAQSEGKTVDDYISKRATIKADTSALAFLAKQSSTLVAAEKTALYHLENVETLLDQGVGTPAGPVLNRWIQAGRRATGDPAVAAFDTAINEFTNEYAKIISGSTGSVAGSTDSARHDAKTMIDATQTPEALRAQLAVAKATMIQRRNAFVEIGEMLKKELSGQKTDLTTPAPGGTVAPGGAAPEAVREVTQEQYNALPPGARYRKPGDSTVRVKQ